MRAPSDFLSFALDMVAAEMGIDRQSLSPLERKIRQQQGGDRHYIGSTAALDCMARHDAIRQALAVPAVAHPSRPAVAERK
jgi:hypothetical protein